MINGVNGSISAYDYCFARNTSTKTKSDIKFSMDVSKVSEIKRSVQTDEPLDYYYELVKKFPEISFRLSDKEESDKRLNEIYYGYNNHTNQVGDNFGEPFQVSVNIDVAIIRRMMKDEWFADQVTRLIQNYQDDYSSWQRMGLSDGDTNFCIMMEAVDWGLGVGAGVLSCAHRFNTEEQMRALNDLWDTNDKKFLQMLTQRRDELEEDFMRMVAENPEDRLTYDQIKEKWYDEYRKMYSN